MMKPANSHFFSCENAESGGLSEASSMKSGRPSGLHVELLCRAPYSARDPVLTHALGVALERQQGVHSIGSDRRVDFDTWPGVVAYTPPGVDVFSESTVGGEYLVVRWTTDLFPASSHETGGRIQKHGHGRALSIASHIRRLILSSEPELLAIEQATLQFIALRSIETTIFSAELRATYSRVLDRISTEFDQPLTIAQLAISEGKTPLRFLREFTQLVGMTPHAFIVETRVQMARRKMERDDTPLSVIAFECGFSHQSHMGSAFRKVLSTTPSQYLSTFRSKPQTPDRHRRGAANHFAA